MDFTPEWTCDTCAKTASGEKAPWNWYKRPYDNAYICYDCMSGKNDISDTDKLELGDYEFGFLLGYLMERCEAEFRDTKEYGKLARVFTHLDNAVKAYTGK